jgi:creatinine amidohydrolase
MDVAGPFPLPTATSPDERQRAALVAVLPVGSFEQHGDHLPLITDTLVAQLIASTVAEAYHLLLLPPLTISCSHEHAAFAGTVSLSARTLHAVITDIQASLQRAGVPKLVLVNGHGGNYVLSNAVQEANVAGPVMSLFPTRADWDTARRAAGLETSTHDDMHAGELEVSLLLAAWPDLVSPDRKTADHLAERPHLLVRGVAGYAPTGVIGRPSLGSADKGRAVLESLRRSFAAHLDLLASHQIQRSDQGLPHHHLRHHPDPAGI